LHQIGKHSEHLRFDRHDCTPCAAIPAARDFIGVAKDQISLPRPIPAEPASERGDIRSKMAAQPLTNVFEISRESPEEITTLSS